jgi:hypothetical protein
MRRLFLLCSLLPLLPGTASPVLARAGKEAFTCQVTSMRRQDMPNDFPYQIFQEGFAVLEVRITNQSGEAQQILPEEIKVFGPRKKELKQAQSTEVAPRLLKYYVRSGGIHPSVYGDARRGYPYPADPNRARYESQNETTVGVPGQAGKLDAGTGSELRSKLEEYRLKSVSLEDGGEVHGYLYVRSKKSGAGLSGGYIVVDGQRFGF